MTPLEFVGAGCIGAIAFRIIYRTFRPDSGLVSIDVASKAVDASVRDAFESGMLCAADIATHEGHEELAGHIRKTVQHVRATNDN